MEKKEKTRKVFLDDLPKKIRAGKQTIDWQNSIGYKVPFVYDDIEGEIEILDYNKKTEKLSVKYNDKKNHINSTDFKRCKLAKILMKTTKDFRIEIGKEFKDDKRDLIITDREYRGRKHSSANSIINDKYYKYTCNKCGWTEGWIVENSLVNLKIGCSCCARQVAVLGINTIWDTDRWMCDLGVSEEDAKKYTKGSNKNIEVICPDCGEKGKKLISYISTKKSIGCICNDGFSYPEKFMYSILSQLSVDFKMQLSKTTFKWCGKYKYDFYIPKYNMIIETHGMQHYRDNTNFKMSLKEVQENDKIKEKIALENGVKHYIIIDCREPDMDWIKNGIFKSELNGLFDLLKIDWLYANEYAIKNNKAKEVWSYWNNRNEMETVTDLIDIFGLSRQSILRYLKNGHKLKLCIYDTREEMKRVGRKIQLSNGRKVEVFKDNVSLGIFNSITEIERQSMNKFGTKMIHQAISSFCSGKYNGETYKGFTFKYVEENNE